MFKNIEELDKKIKINKPNLDKVLWNQYYGRKMEGNREED